MYFIFFKIFNCILFHKNLACNVVNPTLYKNLIVLLNHVYSTGINYRIKNSSLRRTAAKLLKCIASILFLKNQYKKKHY